MKESLNKIRARFGYSKITENTELKLEYGKRYISRGGEVTTPLAKTSKILNSVYYKSHPFNGKLTYKGVQDDIIDVSCTWTPNGKLMAIEDEVMGDLVAEYVEYCTVYDTCIVLQSFHLDNIFYQEGDTGICTRDNVMTMSNGNVIDFNISYIVAHSFVTRLFIVSKPGLQYAQDYLSSNTNTRQDFSEEFKINKTMKQIQLTLETAKQLYKEGGAGKSFALDNYTEEELTKKELSKSWYDLEEVDGFYIDLSSRIKPRAAQQYTLNVYKKTFKTKTQAHSALAMAMLSQLMYEANKGWEPDWTDTTRKYCIERHENTVSVNCIVGRYCFLAFKDKDIRNQFEYNHADLIKTYFQL